MDMLAVCMELLEIPVEVIPVHLESAELLDQSVFDIRRHEEILDDTDERCPV